MKKILSVGLATMMALSLAACSSSNNAGTTTAAPQPQETKEEAPEAKAEETEAKAGEDSQAAGGGKDYVVALCNYSIGNSWRAQMEQEFIAEAEKLKADGTVSEYYITNSNEDINKQISDMQDLITKGVEDRKSVV